MPSRYWIHAVFALLLSFWTAASLADAPQGFSPDDEKRFAQLLEEGTKLLTSHKPKEAIPYFDQVGAAYEEKYKNSNVNVLCARNSAESLFYLTEAAVKAKKSADASDHRDTIVISRFWADAYFLHGYALIDMNQFAEAKPYLEQAIALMPRNAQFLSELGHIYQTEKNWDAAIEKFKQAEESAFTDTDQQTKNLFLVRAWRGIGFALTEQGKLDEAATYYQKCLELDKNDVKAQQELKYIEQLGAKAGARALDNSLNFTRDEEKNFGLTMTKAANALQSGTLKEAIALSDQVANAYEKRYNSMNVKIYCVRSEAERITYSTSSKNAVFLPPIWCDAYYIKALSLIKREQFNEAKIYLDRAIEMAPSSAHYLLDRAFIYQTENNWDAMIEIAQRAEKATEFSSTPENRKAMLARSWRTMGFALIEKGNLDEAEKYYRKVLGIYEKHAEALRELDYIKQLKAKQHTQ